MTLCGKCGIEKEKDDFYKKENGEIRTPCIDCMRKTEANNYAVKQGKEPPYEFNYKKPKKVKWPLLFTIEEKEKEKISNVYRKNSINKTKRVLDMIRSDVKELEKNEKV